MGIRRAKATTRFWPALCCWALLLAVACDYDLGQVTRPIPDGPPPRDACCDAPPPDQAFGEQATPDKGSDAPVPDQQPPDAAPPDIKVCPDLAAGACCPGATRPCYPAATVGCVKQGSGYDCTGTCKAGVETCTGSSWSACAGAVKPLPLDPCNDKDDNCDGTKDEGFPTKGKPCSVTKGKCVASGSYVCDVGKNVLVCSAKPVISAEVCNNKDDDCDGKVDNGVCYSAWDEVKLPTAMDVLSLASGGKVVLAGGSLLKSNTGVIQRLVSDKPEAKPVLQGGAKIISLAVDGAKAVALAADGQVSWSMDSGATWTGGGKCAASNPAGVALSGNTVIVAARGTICSSTNLGGKFTSYTAKDSASGKVAVLQAVAVAEIPAPPKSYTTALAVGYYLKPPANKWAGILFRSFDGGAKWTQLPAKKVGVKPLADFTSPMYEVYLRSSGAAVASGNGEVFQSSTSGDTWKTQPVSVSTLAFNSLAHDPAKGHMMVTSGYGTWVSTDGGKTFTAITDTDAVGTGIAVTVVGLDGLGNGYIGRKSTYGGGAKPGKLLRGKY